MDWALVGIVVYIFIAIWMFVIMSIGAEIVMSAIKYKGGVNHRFLKIYVPFIVIVGSIFWPVTVAVMWYYEVTGQND